MKSKAIATIASCFLGSTLALSAIAVAQQRGAGGGEQAFPQPAPAKDVTIAEIPGVIAAGAKWKLVWQGPDNADGLVAAPDGGIYFAQEQPSTVGRLDAHDNFTIFVRDTHGTGALGIDRKGRLIGVERTCSDPGGHPDQCHETADLVVLSPKWQVLAHEFDGKTFWRMGELVCDSKGGVYFSDDNGTYFVNAKGKVSLVAGKEIRTNGMMLSRDGKTLYVTNVKTLVAWDVQPDGTVKNQRDFATLEAGGNGDGMAIDSEGPSLRHLGRARHSGIQSGREVPRRHSAAQGRVEHRVFRPRQKDSLRQRQWHDQPGRHRVPDSARSAQQRQSHL